jgi:drug/metabolite transporter (DMT)-like permease
MPIALSSRTGMAYGFAAAACYAGLNTAIRFADVHMDIWHIIFYRSLFGAVAMVLLAHSTGGNILGRQRPTLCLLGVAGAAGVIALTVALIVLPLFEALVLLYLFPAFAALLSPWLTRDRLTRWQWPLIAAACLGAITVLWSGQQVNGLQWGHLLALISAFCLGLAFTLTRRISAENSPLTPFFYICAAGAIATAGPILFDAGTFTVAVSGVPALAAVALLATGAHILGNKALTLLPSPQVGVICMAEVPAGALIGLLVFGESFGLQTLIGGMLIIVAGIGLNISRVNPAKNLPR